MGIPRLVRLLAVLLAILPALARADVLVLVHGWAASAGTWIHSGVLPVLESHGWRPAGVVSYTPQGVRYLPAYGAQASHPVYLAQLPAEAPLLLQSSQLSDVLQFIRQRHPLEKLTLVGHSAGGVVARLALIHPRAVRIDSLITIASPHLGTGRAVQGLDIAYGKPFFCPGPGIDFLKRVVGGEEYAYLRDSSAVLTDLTPATPGSLIGWLNIQAHPAIDYHAVIRQAPDYDGDELVPAFSQDLNQVPGLQGRVHVYITPTGHALNPADGSLLASILAGAGRVDANAME